MSKAQVNVRLRKELVAEVDRLVKKGYFSSKTEAFTEALKMVIRSREGEVLLRKIDHVREGTEVYPSPSEAVVSGHEEEDEAVHQAVSYPRLRMGTSKLNGIASQFRTHVVIG